MAERLFDDPDFWFFDDGAASKAECKDSQYSLIGKKWFRPGG
jgi:hypothetical protein